MSLGGKTSLEQKLLSLPTTIDSINKYNENIRKEFKNAYPVIWGLIIILVVLTVLGGIFFGLFKILFF